MLGNDIVDLDLAKTQSNWRRKNYLNKIFTADEQLLITSAKNPDDMVWLLWSMKESAYKIYNRKTGIRNFAPKSLNCVIHSDTGQIHGTVNVDDNTYFTKSDIYTTYLHTIASVESVKLKDISMAIYKSPNHLFDYKSTNPGCVSHHGQYLALVY
ncbi:4-phosphopantetheinyl transferase family protein [Pedobacter psychrodurus]|uniref:4-phosphopantetheinyl transferase family protein n=1 Tax=Pedobacter psychrodurus TaxID=2530456 RepID=A0A4R0PDK5_9SPHI|nr:4'-phosphopantetheinyl transferase superfamily protein [Pedobacter psychrodurus]TCD15845.1 4-phosphopantetheinyl transferase family protein [Pedobacter psychrodurus]